jgi:hypothetical protein
MTALSGAPIRFDRLMKGLYSVLQDGLGSASTTQVAWSYGEGVFDATFPGDFVNLTLSSGPTYLNRSGARGAVMLPPTLLTFTVNSVIPGKRYAVTLNNYQYAYDAVLADTVTTIRNALVALIAADSESPYTALAGVPAGVFTVTPSFFGAIWQASIPGAGSALSAIPTLSTNAVLLTESQRSLSVNFGCFSKTSSLLGAWSIASRIEAILESTDYMETLSQYGVCASAKGPVTDLSAVDNGRWESRVSFDVGFTLQSVHTRPVDLIETLDVTVTGLQPTLPITFQVGL